MNLKSFKKKLCGQVVILVGSFLGLSIAWEFSLKDQVIPQLMRQIPLQGDELRWLGIFISTVLVLLAVAIPVTRLTRFVENSNDELSREHGQAERRYKKIMESTNDLIFQVNPDGYIDFMSSAARLLGYQNSELIGQHVGMLLSLEDRPKVVARLTTKRIGHRATYNYYTQFLTSPKSVLSSTLPYVEFVFDACGLWEEPDKVVLTKGTEKTFVGTLCVARLVGEHSELRM